MTTTLERPTVERLARRLCRRDGADPDRMVSRQPPSEPIWTPEGRCYPVDEGFLVSLWRTYEELAAEMLSGGLP